MKESLLRKLIREEVKRLNEVDLPFDNEDKDLVIGLLNTFGDYGGGRQWNRHNINDADPEWIKSLINKFKGELNDNSIAIADYILRKFKDIDSRKAVVKLSSDGFVVTDKKIIQRDNSGPHATTGTSIAVYTVKTRNGEHELVDWVEENLAKSGYLIDRKIEKIQPKWENVYSVVISTTIWYN